ncbi:hypothetical protein P168DRAFT_287581 [Aspergillus campestris IBT 28561]|uniref:Uncharacterized protein n=1 Tax=Aspergillus campestris (strain IBT 28561) TaxID=1392248 RepID=A0A2I1DB37_ASPC2|nr:uncharacterized protein P168DRAFT_287581 [Aspergillus campestris IBT 28561]PKY07081.1 hypothetical protein P168DRAFT_287581 [Aspergillus campestris IBT 28561]
MASMIHHLPPRTPHTSPFYNSQLTTHQVSILLITTPHLNCPDPPPHTSISINKYPSPSLIPERPSPRRSKGLDPGDSSRQDLASPVPRLGTSPPPFFVVLISSWRLSTTVTTG